MGNWERDLNQEKEKVEEKWCEIVLKAVELSVHRSKGKMSREAVPWWTEVCSRTIKDRDQVFKEVKRTHNLTRVIEYKEKQAKF